MAITDKYKMNQPYRVLDNYTYIRDEEATILLPAYREFHPEVIDFAATEYGPGVVSESSRLRGEIHLAILRAEFAYTEGEYDKFADWAVPHVDLPILRRWLDQHSGLI